MQSCDDWGEAQECKSVNGERQGSFIILQTLNKSLRERLNELISLALNESNMNKVSREAG